ncbi:MAG: flagellar basal body L-ring protein FlgH [Deltaproteobacteria bacterium]|nr:flagellar basal body L-ring protein FlgH [Deltaproteobacteria bacterium]
MTRGAVLLAAALIGCGPPHIAPFTPRNRNYTEGEYASKKTSSRPAEGSIYSEGAAGYLEDTRGVRTGDVVHIRIDERADAKGNATTELTRSTTDAMGIKHLLGLIPALQRTNPNVDPEHLVELASQADFSGDGQTRRAGQLQGVIAVRVKKELPNGDLFIEGTKVVLINHEEYHLYISGVARTADIDMDNSVPSSRIADAQVEFTGRGDVADQVERGWLKKILDSLNPF